MQMAVLAAAAAQAFNLICSGTMTSDNLFTGHRSEPYSYTYRLDLVAGKWCKEECKALFPIVSAQPTQLVLSERSIDTLSQYDQSSTTINRETGEHHILSSTRNPRDRASLQLLEWKGQCEKQPFTGFPKFDTKF